MTSSVYDILRRKLGSVLKFVQLVDYEKKKKKKGLELITILLLVCKTYLEKFSFYHLGNLDDLIQSDFLVIPKITFDNVCKPLHYVLTSPLSSDPLNVKAVERKGKKYKQSNNSRTKRAF